MSSMLVDPSASNDDDDDYNVESEIENPSPDYRSLGTEKLSISILPPEVEKICNIPIGDFNDAAWENAKQVLANQLAEDKTARSVSHAISILDRLTKEPDVANRLTDEDVYPVIQHWCELQCRTGSKKGLIRPVPVWSRLSRMARVGVRLSTETFHQILNGVVEYFGDKPAGTPEKYLGRFKQDQGEARRRVLEDDIVQVMIERSADVNSRVQVSRHAVNLALSSFRSASQHFPKHSKACDFVASRSLELLETLRASFLAGMDPNVVMPDRNTYMFVMGFFADKGDGEKVEELFDEMYNMYLDHGDDATAGDSTSTANENHPAKDLLPDTNLFKLILYAYGQSEEPTTDDAERASDILDRMLELEANPGALTDMEVTADCFDLVLRCWSRCVSTDDYDDEDDESSPRAKRQALFDRMVELARTDAKKTPQLSTYEMMTENQESLAAAAAEAAADDDVHDANTIEMDKPLTRLQRKRARDKERRRERQVALKNGASSVMASPGRNSLSPFQQLEDHRQEDRAQLDVIVVKTGLKSSFESWRTEMTYKSPDQEFFVEITRSGKQESKKDAVLAMLQLLRNEGSR